MPPVKARIRWAARRDGIAHAHAAGMKTLCGLDEIRERDAWPAIRRCLGCETLEAGITEGEARVLWGLR